MRGVVVGGPHVHEEGGSRGDGGVFVDDGFCGFARERHVEGGPVAEDFFDERGHVFAVFVREAAVPGVGGWVGFEDLGVGFCLDFLPVRGGEVGYCHVDIAGEGVQAGGYHS